MKKIVVDVLGGVVQEVYCSDPEFEVILLDHDNDYYTEKQIEQAIDGTIRIL